MFSIFQSTAIYLPPLSFQTFTWVWTPSSWSPGECDRNCLAISAIESQTGAASWRWVESVLEQKNAQTTKLSTLADIQYHLWGLHLTRGLSQDLLVTIREFSATSGLSSIIWLGWLKDNFKSHRSHWSQRSHQLQPRGSDQSRRCRRVHHPDSRASNKKNALDIMKGKNTKPMSLDNSAVGIEHFQWEM